MSASRVRVWTSQWVHMAPINSAGRVRRRRCMAIFCEDSGRILGREEADEEAEVPYNCFRAARKMGDGDSRTATRRDAVRKVVERRVNGEIGGVQSGRGGDYEVFSAGWLSQS